MVRVKIFIKDAYNWNGCREWVGGSRFCSPELRKFPPHSWARGVKTGARAPTGGAETTQPAARMIPCG